MKSGKCSAQIPLSDIWFYALYRPGVSHGSPRLSEVCSIGEFRGAARVQGYLAAIFASSHWCRLPRLRIINFTSLQDAIDEEHGKEREENE